MAAVHGKLRLGVALGVALGALASPATAEVAGQVNGGGFFREIPEGSKGKSQAKMTHLSVAGIDGDEDSGQANYLVKEAKNPPSEHVNLDLDCVTVSGNTAYASGVDKNNDRYYIAIQDNGEPGKNEDRFGIAPDNPLRNLLRLLPTGQCGAGDVSTDTIHGGNYQVSDAS